MSKPELIALLPVSDDVTRLWLADGLPSLGFNMEQQPVKRLLKALKRRRWVENLYVAKTDLAQIKRYKNNLGEFKNDFDESTWRQWLKDITDNIAICTMANKIVGKGVFVRPGQLLPKGTFIPASGIIKLNPTTEDFATKNHCSALQDLSSQDHNIYGLIDPEQQGGLLDLMNHAPLLEELTYFKFKSVSLQNQVATANLQCRIKFYQGYAIMGVEVIEDIRGGICGTQLLWSYAQPDEYLLYQPMTQLLFFDKRQDHVGKTLAPYIYQWAYVTLWVDMGRAILHKVATMTRWQLMTLPADGSLSFSHTDPALTAPLEALQSVIFFDYLKTYLRNNPLADRIIFSLPVAVDLPMTSLT